MERTLTRKRSRLRIFEVACGACRYEKASVMSGPLNHQLNQTPHLRYDVGSEDHGDPFPASDSEPPLTGTADMEVNGPGSIRNIPSIRPAAPPAQPARPDQARTINPKDELEISPAARMLQQASGETDVRAARVAQIKAAIEADEYETTEKLDAALDRLLDEIRRDVTHGG